MDHYLMIDELPVDTVEIVMNGDTFYYSKNRDTCYKKVFVAPAYGSSIHKRLFKYEAYKYILSDFHINNIAEVEENRKIVEQAEKVKNEDWHDKYNELWDKYLALSNEYYTLKSQHEAIPNSK